MYLSDVLIFKNAHRVDWTATEKAIVDQIKKDHPDMRPSEHAMSTADTIKAIQTAVHKAGVYNLYKIFNKSKGQPEGVCTPRSTSMQD
jgi:hypothetical protein